MMCVYILTSKDQLAKMYQNTHEQYDLVFSGYIKNDNLTYNLFFGY